MEREVRRLKGESVAEEVDPEIHSQIPAFFPEEYVSDIGERLILYKRLASTPDQENLDALRSEIVDRFGELPPTGENLIRIIELKILARKCGVTSIRLGGEDPTVEFSDQAPINVDRLVALVKTNRRLTLRPNQSLSIRLKNDTDAVEETKKILRALA